MKELRVYIESIIPDEEVKKAWLTLPIDEKNFIDKLSVLKVMITTLLKLMSHSRQILRKIQVFVA